MEYVAQIKPPTEWCWALGSMDHGLLAAGGKFPTVVEIDLAKDQPLECTRCHSRAFRVTDRQIDFASSKWGLPVSDSICESFVQVGD
jgi:hypothetical protein